MGVPTHFAFSSISTPTLVGAGRIKNGAIIVNTQNGSFVFTKEYGFLPYSE